MFPRRAAGRGGWAGNLYTGGRPNYTKQTQVIPEESAAPVKNNRAGKIRLSLPALPALPCLPPRPRSGSWAKLDPSAFPHASLLLPTPLFPLPCLPPLPLPTLSLHTLYPHHSLPSCPSLPSSTPSTNTFPFYTSPSPHPTYLTFPKPSSHPFMFPYLFFFKLLLSPHFSWPSCCLTLHPLPPTLPLSPLCPALRSRSEVLSEAPRPILPVGLAH